MSQHRHVCSFSGGLGSWLTAKRVAAQFGTERLTLLFTDTLIEDADLYRFLLEGAADVLGVPPPRELMEIALTIPGTGESEMPLRRALLGVITPLASAYFRGKLAWVVDGRTPWDVFKDQRFLGNTRVDLCSRVLKREAADRWLEQNCDPTHTTVYVGIDWTEEHRFVGTASKLGLRARKAAAGWTYVAPLCDAPLLEKGVAKDALIDAGIRLPRLYEDGAAHNNCGGGA